MCGIAGVFDISGCPVDRLEARLRLMNPSAASRPGRRGYMDEPQPMCRICSCSVQRRGPGRGRSADVTEAGLTIVFNGEIYNFRELRAELELRYPFTTRSDTEVILHAYREWGTACVEQLARDVPFAIWDERKRTLFLARDRFGIKPLYTAWVGKQFYFASEVKAMLPFLPDVRIDYRGLRDYLTFQFYLQGRPLPRRSRVPPATFHRMHRGRRAARARRGKTYWQVHYELDLDHSEQWFCNRCSELVEDSVRAIWWPTFRWAVT